MSRSLILAVSLLALVTPTVRADDGITPETVAAIKAATAYIRVEGDGWSGSGSGFVVIADKDRVLVVTNHHVAVKLPPGVRPKPPTVSVVFGSGTSTEREYPATVVASDEDRDLAVLRVAGVKDAPKPILYANPPKPVETMAVISFGFPFGQALAGRKGFPAVTVGKASVSSLRDGDDGELAIIQIDGNLNPGNSGGPVVDSKGRLVGVAVARVRDGQGIGFLVPAVEVGRLMDGRVGRVRVVAGKGADGKPNARVEADLIDPAGVFKTATAYYVVVPPKGKSPDAASLDKHPDARKLVLKVDKGVAAGEIAIEKPEGSVVVQVVGDREAGVAIATRPRVFSLAPGAKPEDLAGPPPAGWKEYTPSSKTFTVWLPEKPDRQSEERRAVTVAGESCTANGVTGKTADGLVYRAEVVEIPPAVGRLGFRLHEAVRTTLKAETKGRITEATDAQLGNLGGAEYRIESGSEITRVRVYVSGQRIYVARVVGTADQVAAAEAETILVSFRRPGDVAAKRPDPPPSTVPTPKDGGSGKEPTIIAGGNAQRFKDVSPDAGLLIGLEIGVGKFGNEDVIKAVRPIYRVGADEKLGEQRGTQLGRVTTIKAKAGYAVGAISYKFGLNFDGCSLTFMKVVDGKLDPKDSYESEWVGWNGNKQPGKIEGDGKPAVGIVGRANAKDVTGLGLLFKGQEGFDPGQPSDPKGIAGKEPKVIGVGKEPYILGSIEHDPKFKTIGPDGAILIGVEVRFAKFGNTDIARALRPIYLVNGKEEFGKQFGADLTGSVTLKAKEGYAVGGVTGKAGWWCNGFSLTFMKVKADGTLDPKDSYESEWAGFNGQSEVFRVMSDGPPVVGIVGKIVGRETTAFGLLYKGQEDFDPNPKKK